MVKSADNYFERMANDPEFAAEMSDRQRRLGEHYGCTFYGNRGMRDGLCRECAREAAGDEG